MSENIKYHHSSDITFECLIKMRDEYQYDELIALTRMFFEQKPDKQYFDRLQHVNKPFIIFAKFDDTLIGCKIGYQTSHDSFYSWIGGVHPDFRRQGIAQNMMQLQIDWCIKNGIHVIRTKTLKRNMPMYALNFKHGYHVTGYDKSGKHGPKLILSKTLRPLHSD